MTWRSLGDKAQNCVCQGGFPCGGSSYHKDILPLPCGSFNCGALADRHDSGGNVIREREHPDGLAADREGGGGDDRGYHRLEPATVYWQFAFKHGVFAADGGAQRGCYGAHQGLRLHRGHSADLLHVAA